MSIAQGNKDVSLAPKEPAFVCCPDALSGRKLFMSRNWSSSRHLLMQSASTAAAKAKSASRTIASCFPAFISVLRECMRNSLTLAFYLRYCQRSCHRSQTSMMLCKLKDSLACVDDFARMLPVVFVILHGCAYGTSTEPQIGH